MGPIVSDGEVTAQAHGGAVVCEREVLEVCGWNARILGAVEGYKRWCDRAGVGLQEAACHEAERRLAPSVVADDAGPSLREGRGHAAKGGFHRSGIGVLDVGKVELHDASGSAGGHAGQQGEARPFGMNGFESCMGMRCCTRSGMAASL